MSKPKHIAMPETPMVSPRSGHVCDTRTGQRTREMGVGRAHGRVSRRRHGGRRSPTWARECATSGGQPVGYRERKPPSGGSKMKATWRGANAYLRTLVAATRPQTPLISALRAIRPAISTFPTSTWGENLFSLAFALRPLQTNVRHGPQARPISPSANTARTGAPDPQPCPEKLSCAPMAPTCDS